MTERHWQPRMFVANVCALVLLLAVLLFSQCGGQPQTAHQDSTPTEQTGATANANRSSAPVDEKVRAADAELARRIAKEIDEGEFRAARWGVLVVSLRDGRTVFARDAERLFLPASSMKLYTTAAALDLLGADYRWRTSVYASAPPDAKGTISGDLTLYGRGAPDLAAHVTKHSPTDHLKQLADDLYQRGVRRVRGRVVGDESYFRGDALGEGWLWTDVQWYFGAEPSALSIDDNEVTVSVAPGAKVGAQSVVQLVPETDYVHVTNDTDTAARDVRPSIGVTRGLSDNEVRVWGKIPVGYPGYGARLAVHGPALWAAQMFKHELVARGIVVEGEAGARDARVREDERFEPMKAVELAATTSSTLGEIAHATNKESINLNAELILRTLGKERGPSYAPAPDKERARERGDDEAGVAVLRRWLRESAGANIEHIALHDGSGLSRLDLITPESTVKLLVRMTQSKAAQVFRDSLPVAGRDGTLAGRLRGARTIERINAKTGTLTYVHALAGYATTSAGEPLAFAIICNEETDRAPGSEAVDAIATLLATDPNFEPQKKK
ncbi:MAG TPA: D-alanyl-D-alanine carboxypeptidase/D-alanyl-D-alanine-endopeptidase [Pyrinomonadaceae bacterium]|nr:D-alanyl-D-alanine carboxypeptidase/D-alanyl-D-alanine-endopeptidase [Pyrinomonadaceae bacterium]